MLPAAQLSRLLSTRKSFITKLRALRVCWKRKMENIRLHAIGFLTCLCLMVARPAGANVLFWTATVETSYWNKSENRTVSQSCDCGLYGLHSPVAWTSGEVTLPMLDPLACGPQTWFNSSEKPWIALIQRGNCTFYEKIKAAAESGASGVVIYNLPGTGNDVTPMGHHGNYLFFCYYSYGLSIHAY